MSNPKLRLRQVVQKPFFLRKLSNPFVFYAVLALPVIIYGFGLLRTGNNLAAGDADYSMQLYEAARTSILNYHQFPWWNPWVSGGIPLFANPQFGPLSIQMVTTLIFGSILGYKVALIIYLCIGFLGMVNLLRNFYQTNRLHAALLSYIWVFSSFFVYRAGGHFTFFVVGFLPWMIYFFLKIGEGKNWLWFAIISSLLIWSSVHYTTIIAFLIVALFGIGNLIEATLSWAEKKKKSNLIPYMFSHLNIKKLIVASLVILTLSAPKLYATLEFTHDYPRIVSQNLEHTTPIDIILYSLFAPDQYVHPPAQYVMYSWMETSSYIGVATFFVLLIVMIIFVQKDSKRSFKTGWLLVMIALCLLLARADFASWAPFTILRKLPVFSSMRVAARWIAWAAFFILLFIGSVNDIKKYKRLYIVVSCLMFITVLELFLVGFTHLNDQYILKNPTSSGTQSFIQHARWNQQRLGIPYDENFTEATRNNIGQIIAGDSLIDTRFAVPTVRCDQTDPNCTFISPNAMVVLWTPNMILVKRLSPGPISLDINPGSHWLINGKSNPALKIVDPSAAFIIEDQSTYITLKYSPPYSPLGIAKQAIHKTGL